MWGRRFRLPTQPLGAKPCEGSILRRIHDVGIGSSAGDCAPAPSHTTGRAVFRIRRLNSAAHRRKNPMASGNRLREGPHCSTQTANSLRCRDAPRTPDAGDQLFARGSGDSGPPCGVPSSLVTTTPSTIAPRRRNFRISPNTRQNPPMSLQIEQEIQTLLCKEGRLTTESSSKINRNQRVKPELRPNAFYLSESE